MVSITDLSQDTRAAWDQYLYSIGQERENDLKSWIGLEEACMLFFILRQAPDKPEIFPRGKWATIQVFEEAIEASIEELLDSTKVD